MERELQIRLVLGGLVLVDASLVVWAFGFPGFWFEAFHTTASADPEAALFLKRCGAAWAGFALFQAIAWWHWDRQPVWLAVVAGIRFADIFTDPIYALFASDPTLFAMISLPATGVANFAVGWFLLTSYLRAARTAGT